MNASLSLNASGGFGAHPESQRLLIGLQLCYTPLLVCLGTVGNALSVFVFFATKLRKLSSSYYLSALAISDTGFLIALFVTWLNLIDVNLFNMPGICQLTVYLTQVCSFLSVWFVVAFTVERFIAVRYPLKRPSVCTVARAKVVLAVLTLFTLTMCSPYLFISAPQWRPDPDSNTNSTVLVCSLVERWIDLATTLNYIDFVVTLLIPFCLIVVLNTLISQTVWRLARVRRSMTSGKPDGGVSGQGAGLKRPILARSQPKQSSSSQTKVTEMLLVVSSVFICLNLPSYVIRVWVFVNEAIQPETPMSDTVILQHYFNLLFNTNFGINFALYCVSGQNFRRALVSLFCRRLRWRQDNTQVTVVSEYTRSIGSLYRRRTVTLNDGSWKDNHELMPIGK